MTSTSVRLVCFDLGGVLVRICRDWAHAHEIAGIASRDRSLNGFASSPQWRSLAVQFSTGEIDCDAWCTRVSAAVDQAYTPEEVRAVHRAWLLGEYSGVDSLIDRIHAAGLRSASLSNTDPGHWETLVTYPTIAKLHHPLASHLLGHVKPDPRIYRAFEDRVKCSGPQIAFFDDLPENVQAALELGWNAVQIDPLTCTATQIARALRQMGIAL